MARGNQKRLGTKLNVSTRQDDDDDSPAEVARKNALYKAEREKKREWFDKLDKSTLGPDAIALLKKRVESIGWMRGFNESVHWGLDDKLALINATMELKHFDKLSLHPEGSESREKLERKIEMLTQLRGVLKDRPFEKYNTDDEVFKNWRDPINWKKAEKDFLVMQQLRIKDPALLKSVESPPTPAKAGWGSLSKSEIAYFKKDLPSGKPMQTARIGDKYYFAYGKKGKIESTVIINEDQLSIQSVDGPAGGGSIKWKTKP